MTNWLKDNSSEEGQRVGLLDGRDFDGREFRGQKREQWSQKHTSSLGLGGMRA